MTHATAQLSPTSISKWNTGMQLVLVATTLAAPVFGYVDHPILHVMWYVGRLVFLFVSMPSLKQVNEQTETAGISASIVSLKR